MTRNILIALILFSLLALIWSIADSREGEALAREFVRAKIRELESEYNCVITVKTVESGSRASLTLNQIRVLPLDHNEYDIRIGRVRVQFAQWRNLFFRDVEIQRIRLVEPNISVHLYEGMERDFDKMASTANDTVKLLQEVLAGLGSVEVLGGKAAVYMDMKSAPILMLLDNIGGNLTSAEDGGSTGKFSANVGEAGCIELKAEVNSAGLWQLSMEMSDMDLGEYGPLVKDIKGLRYLSGDFDWNLHIKPNYAGDLPDDAAESKISVLGDVRITDGALSMNGFKLTALDGVIIIVNDTRSYEGLRCRAGNNEFLVSGEGVAIEPGYSKWDVGIKSTAFDLNDFLVYLDWAAPLPFSVSPLKMELHYSGKLRHGMPESADLAGLFEKAATWEVKTVPPLDIARLEFAYNDHELQVKEIDVNYLGAALTGHFTIGEPGRGSEAGISGRAKLSDIIVPAAGELEAEIAFDGTLDEVLLDVISLRAGELRSKGMAIVRGSYFQAKLRGDEKEKLDFSGDISWPRLNMVFDFQGIKTTDLPVLAKAGLQGVVGINGGLIKSDAGVSITGLIDMADGKIGDMQASDASLKFYFDDDELVIGDVEIALAAGGNLIMDSRGGFVAEGMELGHVTGLDWLEGTAWFSGEGCPRSADFSGKIELKDWKVHGIELEDAVGTIELRNERLDISNFQIGSHISIDGSVQSEEISVAVVGKGLSTHFLWKITGSESDCLLDGEIDFFADIAGTLEKPVVEWEVIGSGGRLASVAYQNSAASGTFCEQGLNIRHFDVGGDDISASGAGRILPDGELNLNMIFSTDKIGDLSAYHGFIEGLEGQGTLEIAVGGYVSEPVVIGNAQLASLFLRGIELNDLGGAFIFKDGAFSIHSISSIVAGRRLEARGTVPITADGKLDIALSLREHADIEADKAGLGTGQMDLHIGGSIGKPEFAGTVSVEGGSLQLPFAEQSITDMAIGMEVREGQVIIDYLTGRIFGGTVMVSGALGMAESSGIDGLIKVEVAGCRINWPEMFEHIPAGGFSYNGRADTKFEIALSGSDMGISGDIVLRDGRFTMPPGAKLEDKIPWAGALEMGIIVGPNVWVENDVAALEVSGRLSVDAHEGRLDITGPLGVNRGSIQWLDNRFQIISGSIAFQTIGGKIGEISADERHIPIISREYLSELLPEDEADDYVFSGARNVLIIPPTVFEQMPGTGSIMVALSAEANIDNVRVNMGVLGTPDNLAVSFSSDPAMPQEQLMTLVNTGETTAESGETHVAGMIQGELSQRIIRDFQRNVGRGLRLDEFRIDASSFFADSGRDGFNVALGKYLDERLYVKIERELLLETETTSVGIEIRTGRNLVIESEINQEDDFKLGLKYKYRF